MFAFLMLLLFAAVVVEQPVKEQIFCLKFPASEKQVLTCLKYFLKDTLNRKYLILFPNTNAGLYGICFTNYHVRVVAVNVVKPVPIFWPHPHTMVHIGVVGTSENPEHSLGHWDVLAGRGLPRTWKKNTKLIHQIDL